MALISGVGDIIAIINLAMHLYDTIIGVARDARREFALFSRELTNLKSTLEGIRRECSPTGRLAIQSNSADQNITSNLEEAVKFTKESLRCWNTLLEEFGRRPQTIPWRIAWARKYPKLSQCRDRIHLQSKYLQLAILRIQTSQNTVIISGIQELKEELRRVLPPLPTISDVNTLSVTDDQVEDESSEGSLSIPATQDTYEDGSSRADVVSVIQSFDERISRLKPQKRSVYCQPQTPDNTPPKEVVKRFEEYVRSDEVPSSGAWLRLGTWWLFKSIKMSEILGSTRTAQPYVDFLKSSWILYSALGMSKIQSPETQEMIELLSLQELVLLENLASAIGYHVYSFNGTAVPDEAEIKKANFNIWERKAIISEFDTRNAMDDSLDPQRWITIKDEHAGTDGEEVLYRSFVQAEIGRRGMRLLPEDTDYMLVLVVRTEETEPTVILSNQAGTVSLSCSCSFLKYINEDPENDTDRKIEILFDETWASMTLVPITFKSTEDYHKFTTTACKYLKAVKDRDPRESETQIFQSILQGYCEKDANSGRPIGSQHVRNRGPRYWELQIHEKASDKYWKTVRRLVISSCARAQHPKCISFFLPLSWIYVSENPREPLEVTVKWSDCNQKDTTSHTGGSFDRSYTYKWSPSNPNHCIKFTFLDEKDAKRFSKTILNLNTHQPLWQSSSYQNPEYQLSHVSDLNRENGPDHYRALVVTKSEDSRRDMEETWKHSEIYFFGKEVDYTIDHDAQLITNDDDQSTIDYDNNSMFEDDNQSINYKKQSTVELLRVYSPLYISNHVNLPQDTITPEFSHTVVKREKVTITLQPMAQMEEIRRQISPTPPTERLEPAESQIATTEVQEFISALSDDWNVIVSVGFIHIEYSQPSLPLLTKTKKTPAYLQVWCNGVSERLVARRISSSSKDSPEWITVQGAPNSSFREAANQKKNTDRIVIQKCTVWRGTLLDTTKMQAKNEKGPEPEPLKVEKFVIRFNNLPQRYQLNKVMRRMSTH